MTRIITTLLLTASLVFTACGGAMPEEEGVAISHVEAEMEEEGGGECAALAGEIDAVNSNIAGLTAYFNAWSEQAAELLDQRQNGTISNEDYAAARASLLASFEALEAELAAQLQRLAALQTRMAEEGC